MSESYDLPTVDRITVGAVGPPGQRLFLLQARQGVEVVTLKLEKVQVAALSQSLAKLLPSLTQPQGLPEDLELEEPAEPEWVVVTLGVGYDEESDRILLIAEELTAEDEDDVMAGDTIFVHSEPGTNQKHGSASGPKEVRDDCANEEEDHVCERSGLAFNGDVDAAGDDEERAD